MAVVIALLGAAKSWVETEIGSGAEAASSGWHQCFEETEDLIVVGLPAGAVLGVDRCAVDVDIEDAATAGDELQVSDDVLIVREQFLGHAHGVS